MAAYFKSWPWTTRSKSASQRTQSYCNKNNDSSVNKVNNSIELTLFIALPNGKNIRVNISQRNDSVLNLKEVIAIKSNIPIEQQHIVYHGTALLNGTSLADYDIRNLSQLTVIKTDQEVTDANIINAHSSQIPDPLAALLLQHNLYDALYNKLTDNNIDLEMLINDIKHNEIEEFSNSLELNFHQKRQFKKLMKLKNIQKRSPKHKEPNYKTTSGHGIERKMDQGVRHRACNEWMKVVLIGDAGVGKTSLMQRYIFDKFIENNRSTIFVDLNHAYETLTDDTIMKMQIWDTAGQEEFQSLTTSYYKTADVVIVCFDVGRDVTLEHCTKWKFNIDEYGGEDVIVIFVGCKGDLSQVSRKSVEEQAQDIMEIYGKLYCECSAKTGENVSNVFLTAAEMVMRQRKKMKEIDTRHHLVDLQATHMKRQQTACCTPQ